MKEKEKEDVDPQIYEGNSFTKWDRISTVIFLLLIAGLTFYGFIKKGIIVVFP
jgi:hypothetical protein